MDQNQKDLLLTKAKKHIEYVSFCISCALKIVEKKVKKTQKDFDLEKHFGKKQFFANLLGIRNKRVEGLKNLYSSPYFAKCDIKFEDEKEKKSIYFGKFSFHNENIYSWITPIASVRFQRPGNISYKRPKGKNREGKMTSKDQYMIVDRKIVYFTKESIGELRKLIYQDYFSTRKTEFILPEIVAQMEEIQDKVIRLHHRGPLTITGPAGSGKTTLALHRVAYLVQSPETTEIYPKESIAVFVQDNKTKEYFSQLLPQLGINNVNITTFYQWAKKILDLNSKIKYISSYGGNEQEKDVYQYQKIQTLNDAEMPSFSKNAFALLESVYRPYFSSGYLQLFRKQKKDKVLDYFDLTILLKSYLKTYDNLEIKKEYLHKLKNGSYKNKAGRFPIKYSLIIVDEFQNYLPDQLLLFKKCLSNKTKSIIYVGDIAQQVRLGTIHELSQIEESVDKDREIVLNKVYRNTRNILEYIEKIGYKVSMPRQVKRGSDVIEKVAESKQEEIKYIKNILKYQDKVSVGILAKDRDYLKEFNKEFNKSKNIHIFSMDEVQGVEFDTVFIVGINEDTFSVGYKDDMYLVLKEEKTRINKDLLYIALTRAMDNLHILGRCKLKDSVNKNNVIR